MRVTFYEPEGGCTPEAVADVLSLAGEQLPQEQVSRWTRLELVMAYDWAMREHLHAADNPVRRRDRPSFLRPVDPDCITGCDLMVRP